MGQALHVDQVVGDRARVDAVHRTELLGSPPEESFDRLTALARRLLATPVAFLSLVDAHADFYKSQCGFGEPLATTRHLEGRTFCHFAIASAGPLVIDDTLADERYRDVPTVSSLGVRAYLGVPIRDQEGHALGSFCAIDFAPRRWSADDVASMVELARSAEREIRLRMALRRAEEHLDSSRAASRAIEQTLAMVAHDLRTPLSVLTMGLELIEAQRGSANVLERMRKALDHSVHLVSDLLHRGRITVGGAELNRVAIEVERLVAEATTMLRPLVERHGLELVELESGPLGTISVDYQLVLRALSNLVVNAVKFSSRGSAVRISAARADGVVRLSVADQGPGLTEEQRARLGQPFWQGDSRDSRGVGLGLAIVRSIVEAHGGTLEIESELGRGTVFTLELPAD